MIVEKTIGNLRDYPAEGRPVDYVGLEWYELDKKLLRKRWKTGRISVSVFRIIFMKGTFSMRMKSGLLL